MPDVRWWKMPLRFVLLFALGGVVWQARALIPPAALEVNGMTLTVEVDRELRRPGLSVTSISESSLRESGLYAWTSVKAPRGLRENIHHVWMHNGAEVDRILLQIEGYESGYRAWTHKLNFYPDVVGNWQVRVVTDSGQLIGLAQFEVVASPAG